MIYSQNELDRVESQATADYIDVMADLAYEMCNALREGYQEPTVRPEVIALGEQWIERYEEALTKLTNVEVFYEETIH
jgi:hypothetical protein